MLADAQESSSKVRALEFGPYKIVRRLGVGGMAETFEAPPSVILPDGRIRGKVPYMSPEQLRNEPLDDDGGLEELRARSGSAPASGRRLKSEPPFGASPQASDSGQNHILQRWALVAVAVVAVVAFAMQ